MAKSKNQWIWAKAKPSKVPDALKREVTAKANDLVEKHIRPKHVEPPPRDPKFNYVQDIFTKWPVFSHMTVDEALALVRSEGLFHP